MEEKNNIDNKILNLMLLNPHLSYIQGYTNIYHKKNQNDNNNQPEDKFLEHAFIANQINNEQNQDKNKNNNKNAVIPSIYNSNVTVNMNPGGLGQVSNSISENNNLSNFSIYVGGKKIDNSKNIPEQFKEYNQNNNIYENNINNKNKLNEESQNKSDNSPNIAPPENILNPICHLFIPTNNNKKFILKNSLNNLDEEEKNNLKIESQFMEKVVNSLVKNSGNNQLNPEELKSDANDNKINITFILKDKNLSYNLRVNPDEKFGDILSDFLQKNNLNDNYISLLNYAIINKEKTVRENCIKNGDKILLHNIKGKNNSKLEEDDLEILNSFLDEYKAEKLTEFQIKLKNAIKNQTELPKFEYKINQEELAKFLMIKIKKAPSGITIREHPHPLVCCLTNNNWTCNQCNKTYNEKNEKFCCSLCDYNMCHECRKLKNYDRRKTINQDTPRDNGKYRDKYLSINNLHEHKLLFCITSRFYLSETYWNCDICGQKGNNWSFYCTYCDYDLCFDCFKKHKK